MACCLRGVLGIMWRKARGRPLGHVCWLLWCLALLLFCCLVFVAGAGAAGDATSDGEPCPNEALPGFRSYLPECRGYEMVTPNFKDGAELDLTNSENGLGAIAESLGGFAGAEYDSELKGATYQLSRLALGWSVSEISPPSSSYPAQEFVAASPELASTLWLAREPSESIAAENFYIRGGTGAMTRIGSVIPPALAIGPPSGEYQGFIYGGTHPVVYSDVSGNLSHVLFMMVRGGEDNALWPGDATVPKGSSLYEYSGTGQVHPELVGVNNEGHQISTCSTWLGSNTSQDVYNAISADGSAVFFTALAQGECSEVSNGPEVNELFARVDGLETVAISEPSMGACSACDESERKPAEFVGASRDGSKVFFLTEQKLLAGAEGMNLYEYDFDAPEGEHVILVSAGVSSAEVQGVARVSEDGSHVYFVARGRLGVGPRGGPEGPCIAEATAGEQAQEAIAEKDESKSEPVTTSAKCRPRAGGENLYVFQRDTAYPAGHVSFIATLCAGEEAGQCPSFRSDAADWAAHDQRGVQATPDGRFLVFQSVGDLTAGDTSGVTQVFEYDAVTGELVRVSKERTGYTPAANLSATKNASTIPVQRYSGLTRPTTATTELAVSDDGSRVVFASAGALTAEAAVAAAAEVESVYEYRSSVGGGGSIAAGSVYLLSGESTATVRGTGGLGVDGSGQDVFFVTAESLVAQDVNTMFDTYDARVDGGFLAPDPPSGCVAEACEEPLVVPSLSAPASTAVTSAGSVSAPSVVGSSPVVAVKRAGSVVLSRRQRLLRALRGCTRMRRSKQRVACESEALKRYAGRAKAEKTARGSK